MFANISLLVALLFLHLPWKWTSQHKHDLQLCKKPCVYNSELNITGRLPEAGNLKPNITRPLPEKTCTAM